MGTLSAIYEELVQENETLSDELDKFKSGNKSAGT